MKSNLSKQKFFIKVSVQEKQSEIDELDQELETLRTQVNSQRGQIEDTQSQLAQRIKGWGLAISSTNYS